MYVSPIFNKNSRHLPDISGTCTFCLDNTTLLVQIRSYIQQGCFYLCLSVHMIKQKVVNYFSFLSPFTHRLTAIFPGGPGLANTRMSPLWTALANGGGIATVAVRRAKLQSNHHHQQTYTEFFYRWDAFPVAQPTVSEHLREM